MATRSKNERAGESANWTEQVRQILLAAVGAVVVAQDQIEDFVQKLVKRGEMAEKDGKKLLNDILVRRKKEVNKGVANLESDLQSRIEAVLHTMKLVTKRDVDQLAHKIDSLAAVVDRMTKEKRAH